MSTGPTAWSTSRRFWIPILGQYVPLRRPFESMADTLYTCHCLSVLQFQAACLGH